MIKNSIKSIISIILIMVLSVSVYPLTINSYAMGMYDNNAIENLDECKLEALIESKKEKATYPEPPGIYGASAILMDGDTGAIIYDNESHKRLFPASITKIMTGILSIENCFMDDRVTFTNDIIEALPGDAAKLGALVGEQLTVKDSLYALFIRSYNDVAMGLAYTVSGDEEGFAKLMTEKAKAVGALDTNFVNATGLHDENHYTTAYDMAMITKYAIKNPVFMEITGTYQYILGPTNACLESRDMVNRHNMLVPNRTQYYEYAISGKTGYTDEAGRTLVTVAKKAGKTLICVIMKSDDDHVYDDTKKLFEYGFGHFENINIFENEERFSQNKDNFFNKMEGMFISGGPLFSISQSDYVTVPKGMDISSLSYKIEMLKEAKNGKIGTVKYYYGKHYMGETTIGNKENDTDILNVEPLINNDDNDDAMSIKDIPINVWIVVGAVILVIGLVTFVIYLIKTKEKRKRARERRKIFKESRKRFKRRKRIRY